MPGKKVVPAAVRAADPRAAIIVCLDFGDDNYEESVAEVVRLVESAGVVRHRVIGGRRSRPDPKFYALYRSPLGDELADPVAPAAFPTQVVRFRNARANTGTRTGDNSHLAFQLFCFTDHGESSG